MSKIVIFTKGTLIASGIILISALILAAIMLKVQITDTALSIITAVMYFFGAFAGGLYCGKKIGSKRFIWGFLFGLIYSIIYLLVVGLTGGLSEFDISDYIIAIGIGTGGGMFGGMIS